MKELKINITKAQISKFSVEIRDDKVNVSATITLLTEGNKRITEYSISTDSWQEVSKFTLPMTMIEPIKEIMRQLEEIVTDHCANRQKMLE